MRISTALFLVLHCCAVAPTAGQESAPTINAMSFNLRYNTPNDGVHAWPLRKELVATTIRFHRAEVIGVQEALHDQMMDLEQMLPEYKWVGVGRDDGKTQGEYAAIFYRHARFELLASGNFWLSEKPEQAGSVGWDAAITRLVTWAKLRDGGSGKTFFHFNTHFDHMGQKAREESAKLLRARITAIAGTEAVVLTGDFNATEASPVYKILVEAAPPLRMLKNARALSTLPHHGPDWTFHGFGKATERTTIDFIFVSEGMRVLRHAALFEYGEERYPSDHLPVFAEVVLE